MVVLKVAAEEQSVVAAGGDLVIELENIGVVLGGIVAGEGETGRIQAVSVTVGGVAAGGAVGQGIF